MSRSFSTQILDELQSEQFKPFHLLHLTIDGTDYYYTDCDIPLYYDSQRWEPRGFTFRPIKYSMSDLVDSADIDMDNIDSVMTSLFVGGTPQGDDVVLKMVVLDSSNNPVAGSAVTYFEGTIDSWTLNESKLTINVTSQFYTWNQKTLSTHSPSCRWKSFGGTDCGYSGGSTWCDRTYKRCVALGNSTNFGGFRFLPKIVDAEIWWGREQS